MSKRSYAIMLAISILSQLVYAQSSGNKPDAKSFRHLLDATPRTDTLERCKDILANPNVGNNKESKKWANEEISKAKKNIPIIRAMIKNGSSIFDYPGLLAHGRISYEPVTQRKDGSFDFYYKLYIGIYLSFHEGTGPYDFEVVFDEKGIITQVKNAVWKK